MLLMIKQLLILPWFQVEALRTEVSLAVERTEARGAEERATATVGQH